MINQDWADLIGESESNEQVLQLIQSIKQSQYLATMAAIARIAQLQNCSKRTALERVTFEDTQE